MNSEWELFFQVTCYGVGILMIVPRICFMYWTQRTDAGWTRSRPFEFRMLSVVAFLLLCVYQNSLQKMFFQKVQRFRSISAPTTKHGEKNARNFQTNF
eukprot:TRINITY_DN4750_c0_g1_i1.p1 TRINITY_DN4750_c0_g1~~TRINITY_DN4750_c0_g1_i1.p1  ORF type:complete len:98 (-),score=6.55 TRINITY_DN4750_c0_g1_i1:278-571(-)